ncbi:MAG: hypothetical protein ACOX0B_01255 [Minisyncoccales bacterium]|jgi:hypothetical protein
MKKNKNIFIVLIFLLLIIVSIVFFYNKSQNKNLNLEEFDEKIEWNLYQNKDLGFSIELPLEIATVSKCPNNKMVSAPIKVFENNENNVVYIAPEYYYDASWSSEEQKFTKECTKIVYSLDMLEDEEVKKPFLGWKININNIENEEDILKAIKDNFGPTCEIKDKIKDEQGNCAVSLYGSDWDFNDGLESGCMINYSYRIMYSKDENKMMSVILGQECTFGTDPNIKSYYCYDEDMINSFRFY